MARPDKGIDSGRLRRRLSSERRMRWRGILASMSARAVRSTIRSWKEKRYSRRGPRAGCTKPARIRLRVVSGASCRTRSTSRTLYERIPIARRRRAPSGVTLVLARHLGGFFDALGSLARTQARDLRAGALGLGEARTQCLHQVDDLAFSGWRCFGHGDLLAFDLLLDGGFAPAAQFVLVRIRIVALGGLLVDELLGQFQLRWLH